MADENPAPEAEAPAAPEAEAPAAPEAEAPAPEAEAPPESSDQQPPAEEAQAPDQAPPEAEAKTEAESDIESTTATGHEGTEGAADASSSMPSPSGATEETSPSEGKQDAPEGEEAPTKTKSSALEEQKKSVERLSRPSKAQLSKSDVAAGKAKSKSIAFDRTPEEKETEQLSEGEEAAKDEISQEEEAEAPGGPEARERHRRRKSRSGILAAKSSSITAKPRYQNTYRLDSKFPFNVDRVYTIIKTTMDKALEEVRYNPEQCSKLVMSLSEEIKTKVKLQNYERYKIAVQVIIGEKKQQSVYSIMRFLWDVERDHYSIYTYESTTLFAIAIALGVYYE